MFFDAILAKKRIFKWSLKFSQPCPPWEFIALGVWWGGHQKCCGPVVCSDLVLVGFCVLIKHWCPWTSLDLIAFYFLSPPFQVQSKFDLTSSLPCLELKKCWSSEWSVALLTVQIKACRSHLFGLVRLGRGGVHAWSGTWSFMFFDAILAKRKRISSDHSNFPNPCPPWEFIALGVWWGGHQKCCGPVVCSDLVLVGFCVLWSDTDALEPRSIWSPSIFLLHHFKFNPSSIWPVRSHALNWKKCWSSEWSVALLTVQIKACR